jgi:hypothetical protein
MWVAPARISGEDFDRCESIYVLWTAIPNPKTSGWGRTCMPAAQKTKSKPSTKDEAQLNCVALRPQLDYEVAWRPVKGQDERQKTAPLTGLHATGRSFVDLGEKNGGPPRRP